MKRPAVFVDRDGTLIEEAGYLDRLERLVVYPWSIDAVRLLNRAGFSVFVVTNQAGVARGLVDESFVHEAHRHLTAMFAAGGAQISACYYCPHHPDATVAAYRQTCDCRKPKPGMIRRAAQEFSLDLSRSFLAGDKWIDIESAQAAGVAGILVRTGYGESEARRARDGVEAAAVVSNLMEAVSWILTRGSGVSGW